LMTAAVAVWVSAPFIRRLDERHTMQADALEVYRDQLVEVDRETASGTIDEAHADAARGEIKRRLLAADKSRSLPSWSLTLGERHSAITLVAGIVTLGSVILYANSGRPDIPSVARPATSLVLGAGQSGGSGFQQATPGAATASAQSQPQGAVPQAQGSGAAVGSVDEMIERLQDRLKKEPNNGEMWRMLGWSYFSTDRYPEAADAYRKAVQLLPGNADFQTALGEALVRAANGAVQAEATAAFDAALAIDAKDVKARFFKGLAVEQAGNKRGALDAWLAVLADAKADDTWASDLRARVVELAKELGVDVSDKVAVAAATGGVLDALKNGEGKNPLPALPAPAQATASTPAVPALPLRGPSATDVKAAETMSPADRTAMIRGMVDSLAARLEKSPRDGEGWIQLIRSRRVLGDTDGAKAALQKALSTFADAPPEQARIEAAAAELGIKR
jgi:cytochrome c-type biogenesis protein CcmH